MWAADPGPHTPGACSVQPREPLISPPWGAVRDAGDAKALRRRALAGCRPGLHGKLCCGRRWWRVAPAPPSPPGLSGVRLVPHFQLSFHVFSNELRQHSCAGFSAVPGLKTVARLQPTAHAPATSHPLVWLVTPLGAWHPQCPGSARISQPLTEPALSPRSQVSSRGSCRLAGRAFTPAGTAVPSSPPPPGVGNDTAQMTLLGNGRPRGAETPGKPAEGPEPGAHPCWSGVPASRGGRRR